jgi:phage terminase large subunit
MISWQEQLSLAIEQWRMDPVQFVRDNFSAEPDEWQKDALMSLVTHDRICMKACKGPGKSCVLAWAILWFLMCYPHCNLLATSITGDNLRDGLWKEIAYWKKKSPIIDHMFEWQAERIYCKEHPEDWWCSARTWSKGADMSKQNETLAGLHAEYTMIIMDEAGGIPSSVAAAATASLSTGIKNMILMAGNPTTTEGPLYDACTRERHLFKVIEITGDPDDPKRSPRIKLDYARAEIEKWGRNHPYVLVNIFGKFPPSQSDKLLGPEEVKAAMERTVLQEILKHSPVVCALDVARFGDDSSQFCHRHGPLVYPFIEWRNADSMTLADQVASLLAKIQPDAFFVDTTGLGGPVADRIRQLGYDVIDVDFGSKAMEEHKYLNRRAEMWFTMADAVKRELCLPQDFELSADLTSPTFKYSAGNGQVTKLKLEGKEEIKKRTQRSPDKGDALALTYAAPIYKLTSRSRRHPRVLTEYDPFDDNPRNTEEEAA